MIHGDPRCHFLNRHHSLFCQAAHTRYPPSSGGQCPSSNFSVLLLPWLGLGVKGSPEVLGSEVLPPGMSEFYILILLSLQTGSTLIYQSMQLVIKTFSHLLFRSARRIHLLLLLLCWILKLLGQAQIPLLSVWLFWDSRMVITYLWQSWNHKSNFQPSHRSIWT